MIRHALVSVVAVSAAAGLIAAVPAAADPPRTNHGQAMAEIHALLTDPALPASATPVDVKPPAPLRHAPDVESAHPRLNVHELFSTTLTFAQATHWIRHHRPHPHLHSSLSGYGTWNGIPWSFRSWDDRSTEAYDDPSLDYTVAANSHGDGTVWRLDATDYWFVAKPRHDRYHPRVRVTESGGCPASTANDESVTNPGRLPARRLVPAATPTSALLCVYSGGHGKHLGALVRSRRVGATAAARVSDDAAAITLAHLRSEETSCPPISGPTVVVDLGYATRADVDLWYEPNTCFGPFLANGSVLNGDADDKGPFVHAVARLAGLS